MAQKRTDVYINHVGVAVPSVPDALAFYTQKMGFREAFRQTSPDGKLVSAYVQVSKNTFIELQEANAQRPAGVSHFGMAVDSIEDAVKMFRAGGDRIRRGCAERVFTRAAGGRDRPQWRPNRACGIDAGFATAESDGQLEILDTGEGVLYLIRHLTWRSVVKAKLVGVVLAVFGVLVISAPLSAHHGTASFDTAKDLT